MWREANDSAETKEILAFPATNLPASVAQLDTRPTGDQEVAGSTPAEIGNVLCGD